VASDIDEDAVLYERVEEIPRATVGEKCLFDKDSELLRDLKISGDDAWDFVIAF